MKIPFKQNVGLVDRTLRVGVGIVLLATGIGTEGIVGIALVVLSIPILVSGFLGFCPGYTLWGISTRREERSCC